MFFIEDFSSNYILSYRINTINIERGPFIMASKELISAAIEVAKAVGTSDDFKSFMCGTYSDGTPRSLPDALNDEILSPKQKKKAMEAKEKQKKKKKKKKYAKLKL